MKQISQTDLQERDQIVAVIAEKRALLLQAIAAYNEVAAQAWTGVEQALDEYNESILPVKDWITGIVADMSNFIIEQTPAWRDSAEGEAYYGWKNTFQNVYPSLFPVHLEKPVLDFLEKDDPALEDHPTILRNLPETPINFLEDFLEETS